MSIAAVMMALALAGVPGKARCEAPGDDLWAPGRNWLSLRAGYAKASGELNGDGGIGYGFGFSHLFHPYKLYKWTFLKQFSIGAYVHHEVLDHFQSSVEVEVPATVELVRYFKWNTALKPYLGYGMGAFYRKAYRTGADNRTTDVGSYWTFGANAPIGGRQLLGFDGRLISVDSGWIPPDPVFGQGTAVPIETLEGPDFERKNGTHWSAKINYTIVY
jgi:hypothetical protein